MKRESNGRRLKTVETTIQIIDAIQELDGARVSELSDHLDIPASTVQGHLNTLVVNGYLGKEGDQYYIGLQFLDKGGYTRHRKEAYQHSIKKVDELANKTDERAQFIIHQQGRGIYLHTATGSQAVQVDARIGKVNHLHASAAGKAVLAYLSEEYINDLVENYGLPRLTENTITEKERLHSELETIREQKISFNKEESIDGLRAVGVPIIGRDSRPIGGLSVSGPKYRMKGEWFRDEIPDLLLGSANEIELKTEYSE